MVEWVGVPGKRHITNILNSQSPNKKRVVYPYPSEMFQDSDGDGVADVFDCSPRNPKKQGLIDAIIGGVKGLGKGTAVQGFKEGMARQGNPVTRAYQAARERRTQQRQEVLSRRSPVQVSRAEQRAIVQRLQAPAKEARRQRIVQRLKEEVSQRTPLPLQMEKGNPMYARRQKINYYQSRALNPKLTPQQRQRAAYLLNKAKGELQKKKEVITSRAIGVVFPVPSLTSYGSGSGKTIPGIPGRGRGRPRGSLDQRYAAYGGVYGYRKYVSEQKKKLRQQLALQQQMKVARLPQYETQAYTGQAQVQQVQPQVQPIQQAQLPSELQGQQITPEYAQFLAEQQAQTQYQQVPQQIPQQYQYQQPQPTQRPIGTVFKSSGGSPYPAVNSQPRIAPSSETIPYGYVEAVDLMTGRKYIKKLPPSERWTRQQGGYQ